MNFIKSAFIKTVILPISQYFFNEYEKLDGLNWNSPDHAVKIEKEHVRLLKEFYALPPMIQKLVGETRKSYMQ